MAAVAFDPVEFRAMFPAFASAAQFPDSVLSMWFAQAGCYVENEESPCVGLTGDCLKLALYQLTAHLAYLNNQISQGTNPGLVTGATVDVVTVSLQAPPVRSQWQWWLSLTPYGQQLAALLSATSVGGFYIGGRPERSAFRKVYGSY